MECPAGAGRWFSPRSAACISLLVAASVDGGEGTTPYADTWRDLIKEEPEEVRRRSDVTAAA